MRSIPRSIFARKYNSGDRSPWVKFRLLGSCAGSLPSGISTDYACTFGESKDRDYRLVV